MNILVVNPILVSAEYYIIPEISSIKETMIYTMCLGFVANGHQVTLAAAADYKPVPEEEGYDFEVLFFKSVLKRLFYPAALPLSFDFYKYLKANHKKFDLVISSEIFSIASFFASVVCPAKTVIWHEMTIFQNKLKKIPAKLWYWVVVPLFIRRVRCIIPRSGKAASFIRKYLKNVSEDIVDHGINVSKFNFSKEKNRQVISSSRLVPGKNIESIILIYSKLIKIKGFEDIKLLIAGDGFARKSLESLVEELNLQKQVTFSGFLKQKELNEVIKKSLVFMINTLRDQNMLSIPESIVSGTPVITNLLPASADYIAREKLGIAKDKWDEFDLIEIIENNRFYVDNCVKYRDKQTNSYCAKQIVDIFLKPTLFPRRQQSFVFEQGKK